LNQDLKIDDWNRIFGKEDRAGLGGRGIEERTSEFDREVKNDIPD
jgi:hypothetical protein